MSAIAILHLFAIAFWLGVVSVEFAFERARIGKTNVIRLHKTVDRYIELPSMIVVLITGLLLWHQTSWSLEYLPKVLAGLGAVIANVLCYYFVETRQDDSENFKNHSHWLFKLTVFGLLCFVVALVLGAQHAGWL